MKRPAITNTITHEQCMFAWRALILRAKALKREDMASWVADQILDEIEAARHRQPPKKP